MGILRFMFTGDRSSSSERSARSAGFAIVRKGKGATSKDRSRIASWKAEARHIRNFTGK